MQTVIRQDCNLDIPRFSRWAGISGIYPFDPLSLDAPATPLQQT
jgi:hypothetical protein